MDQLIISRFNAHANYLIPRIHNERKRAEFIHAYNAIMNGDMLIFTFTTQGGKMAIDIFKEIQDIHTKRFVAGYSGDAMLEKL